MHENNEDSRGDATERADKGTRSCDRASRSTGVPARARLRPAAGQEPSPPRDVAPRAGPPSRPEEDRSPSVVANVGALPYLLTVEEVAALLRTTRKAIYTRIERGLLPGVVRDGRRILLERDDVLQWIAERRTASPGGPRR